MSGTCRKGAAAAVKSVELCFKFFFRAGCSQCQLSKHFSLLRFFFGSQSKPQFNANVSRKQRYKLVSNRRAMLKTVTGAAANQPDVFKRGVTINQEVAVRSVFILANP